MNHAARPPAFSYVRSQGPRGITIRTGRESPAQPSPGLSGRQSPSAGKAKRPHNAALGSRSCPREDPVAHNYNGHGADSFEPSSLHTATLLRIPRGPAPPRVPPAPVCLGHDRQRGSRQFRRLCSRPLAQHRSCPQRLLVTRGRFRCQRVHGPGWARRRFTARPPGAQTGVVRSFRAAPGLQRRSPRRPHRRSTPRLRRYGCPERCCAYSCVRSPPPGTGP